MLFAQFNLPNEMMIGGFMEASQTKEGGGSQNFPNKSSDLLETDFSHHAAVPHTFDPTLSKLILWQKKTDISPNKARKMWNQRSISFGNVLRRKQLEKWHQLPGKEGSG